MTGWPEATAALLEAGANRDKHAAWQAAIDLLPWLSDVRHPVDPVEARRLLWQAAIQHRWFEIAELLACAMASRLGAPPALKRLHAQMLLERGFDDEALARLDDLRRAADLTDYDRGEVLGHLGRIHKDRFVAAVRAARHGRGAAPVARDRSLSRRLRREPVPRLAGHQRGGAAGARGGPRREARCRRRGQAPGGRDPGRHPAPRSGVRPVLQSGHRGRGAAGAGRCGGRRAIAGPIRPAPAGQRLRPRRHAAAVHRDLAARPRAGARPADRQRAPRRRHGAPGRRGQDVRRRHPARARGDVGWASRGRVRTATASIRSRTTAAVSSDRPAWPGSGAAWRPASAPASCCRRPRSTPGWARATCSSPTRTY